MPDEKKNEQRPVSYHGMSWPVRLIVYFCCGLVLMAIVSLRSKWDDLWWFLWIPPVTGLLGVLFPRAADWLFARINDLLHLRR